MHCDPLFRILLHVSNHASVALVGISKDQVIKCSTRDLGLKYQRMKSLASAHGVFSNPESRDLK